MNELFKGLGILQLLGCVVIVVLSFGEPAFFYTGIGFAISGLVVAFFFFAIAKHLENQEQVLASLRVLMLRSKQQGGEANEDDITELAALEEEQDKLAEM